MTPPESFDPRRSGELSWPGGAMQDAAPPRPGERLGRFDLQAIASTDGSRTTLMGVDGSSGVPVKVHVIVPGPTDTERRTDAAFRRAAAAMRGVSHPSLVRVIEVFERREFTAVVTERVTGQTALDALAGGPLRKFRVARWIGPAAEALEALADAGLVHCNLGPEVLIQGPDGVVRVDDAAVGQLARGWFAAQGSHRPTAAGVLPVGRPAYAAPELLAGAVPDHRTDIYGLAAVLFQLVTGKPPYTGTTAEVVDRILKGPPPPATQVTPGVDAPLSDLIGRCLARDPRARPQTWDEFLTALGHIRSRPRIAPPVGSSPMRGVPPAGSASSSGIVLPGPVGGAHHPHPSPTAPAVREVGIPPATNEGYFTDSIARTGGGVAAAAAAQPQAPADPVAAPSTEPPKRKTKVLYFRGQRIEQPE